MLQQEARYKADCFRCQSLCCIALNRRAANGFGRGPDKMCGTACEHLDRSAFRCKVFGVRDAYGYAACGGFDCFGAGQTITAVLEARGLNWTNLPPDEARPYFEDLNTLFRIHLLLAGLVHGVAKDDALLSRLRAASDGYGTDGAQPLQDVLAGACAEHAPAVHQILVAAGYAGG